MTSIATLENAILNIEIAFKQIEFALKLSQYCRDGKVDPIEFDRTHIVYLDEGNLHFPFGTFNKDNIVRAAEINISSAFAASAIALDNAFEALGMKANPEATDNEGQCRTVIYMVRCAYGHGIAEPCWEVRGKYARILNFNLEDILTSINLQKLNGKVFDFADIGGYRNWYRLKDWAIKIISDKLNDFNIGK